MAESRSYLTYEQAKSQIIDELLRCISEHEAGLLLGLNPLISDAFNAFDFKLTRAGGPEFEKIYVAFHLWEGWLDSSVHNWRFYEPIKARDWPRLARIIIDDLKADRDISDPIILSVFRLTAEDRAGCLERLKRLFI